MPSWLSTRWRLLTLICLATVAIAMGTCALYEPRADHRFFGGLDGLALVDAIYLALSLFTLNDVGPSPAPLLLQVARFAAATVTFSTLLMAFFTVMRGNPDAAKARKLQDHAVIVGTGPEALRLAVRHAQLGNRPVWVGDVDVTDTEAARAAGVTLPGPSSDAALRAILAGAKSVTVTAPSDTEAVGLAREIDHHADAPLILLLDSSDLASQLLADQALNILPVPRLAVVAREAVAANPPIREAACPAPIVVGDGELAAEIVRQIARGWQEYGAPQRIHCVGSELSWVDAVEAEVEGLADLRRRPAPATPRGALTACRGLIDGWTRPNADKVASTGPAIIVAIEDDARALSVARGLQCGLPTARVSVVVESAGTWTELLGTLDSSAMVSTEELLAEPDQLGKDRAALLRVQLSTSLATWSSISRSVFGDYLDGRDAAPDEGEDLADRLTERLLGPVAGSDFALDRVLGAGGLARTDEDTVEAMPLLDPGQLHRMAAELLAVVDGLVPTFLTERDRWAWGVEFSQWLPVACARAGWGLEWPHATPVLPAADMEEFAVALHAAYLVTSEQTGNATGSDLAHVQWPGLSEEDKASNRSSARAVTVKLASLGLDWRSASSPVDPWRPDADTLTWLGEAEHRRWARHQVAHGRRHRHVRGWADLAESTRRYDTDAVLAHFSHLADLRIDVFDPAEDR
ncbi:hypothetical protein [Tessaracoccus defluvii]|uniref:NAD-binding protein n=1 Tax=Tessaracoccus defluvii TaxID=1285901 RepID=A0A7H0H2T5_9ACTN|nr:hypothetical protein [Tessaracoccus defluvii]QNP54851.1 hypothetical protein H9L22_11120 [Tessaracoccus defluvii]